MLNPLSPLLGILQERKEREKGRVREISLTLKPLTNLSLSLSLISPAPEMLQSSVSDPRPRRECVGLVA